MVSLHAEALVAADAEVLRFERLNAGETCAVFDRRWCDVGDVDIEITPAAFLCCSQGDEEKVELLPIEEEAPCA